MDTRTNMPGRRITHGYSGLAFQKKKSSIINRCHMYLQVFSIMDILLSQSDTIHLSYIKSDVPPSRISTILWPPIPKPPKSYWRLWRFFLTHSMPPLIPLIQSKWNNIMKYRFIPCFFKHNQNIHLYRFENEELSQYHLQSGARSRFRATYHNAPYECNMTFSASEFTPVDVQYTKTGISIAGTFYNMTNQSFLPQSMTNIASLHNAYSNLQPSIKEICGTVIFPQDDGEKLYEKTTSIGSPLFGVSDTSYQHYQAACAWILSSGDPNDIMTPDMTISGYGPVHGYPPLLSSARSELQGLTAATIISNLFLSCKNSPKPC